ncbi:hypothetical protein [Shimia aestuarii]|uniref:DNA primase/helicase n=1 Tax=Shimia aestuarii TaxID=254406 RepID=A0A1I4RPT5_9RHOB|nr:hypothetical protein [Shimia aestuarii]SFM54267.1 hypothetical protein SAMN04488042_108170 [Shimia aestuarii]
MRKDIETQAEQSHLLGDQSEIVGDDPIATAFKNGRPVDMENEDLLEEAGEGAATRPPAQGEAPNARIKPGSDVASRLMVAPVVALGHDSGNYYFIPPSGQLRKLSAEQLEGGRGVKALFAGNGPDVEEWCRSEFPARNNDWCHKQAGMWIIEKCNAKGVFDPSSADLRSIGVWRDQDKCAVAHCGDMLFRPDGKSLSVAAHHAKHVTVGARPIAAPDFDRLPFDSLNRLMHEIERLWGWQRDVDASIWFGWVAAASLGGFPNWRTHLYVHGSRGSGKSKLIELADCLLGDLSGEVINDATEAGLRQSRNNQARPLLIDEFEPDDNPRNSSRQDSMLALFRRMSGEKGGRISRGGSDHSAVSFRMLGSAYVTSINHIHLEPQDRSRFAVLELGSIPKHKDPMAAAGDLERLFAQCATYSQKFRGRLLQQSVRWDDTHKAISAKAQSIGADPRQAATAATILTGLDLALFDGQIDQLRLDDLQAALEILISDSAEADEGSEGRDVLDHLLSTSLSLDHGVKRTVRELICSDKDQEQILGVDDAGGALRRHGIFVDSKKRLVSLRTGRSTPTAKLYADTKWRNGAHSSALQKLEGVVRPKNSIRLAPNEQHRVVQVPFACLGFAEG